MNLRPGACYSNGSFGRNWAVRQVLAVHECDEQQVEEHCVHYKVVVGENRRKRLICGLREFLDWARYEVVRSENEWERLDLA